MVVIEERPDLEVQRNALIMQSVENARRLLAVEDRILEVLLYSSTTHMLSYAQNESFKARRNRNLIFTVADLPVGCWFVATLTQGPNPF